MVVSVQQLVPLIVCLQFGVVQVVDSKFIRAFFYWKQLPAAAGTKTVKLSTSSTWVVNNLWIHHYERPPSHT